MNKAFQQGELDSLCGVYALLNAYRLLVPRISKATFHRLFTESVVWLNGQGVLLDAVTDGLEAEHLLGMIQHTFRPVFPFIEVERLWAKKEQAEPELLNLLVKKYVALPNSTVLVCFENQAYGHWTVFQKADEKRTERELDHQRKVQCVIAHNVNGFIEEREISSEERIGTQADLIIIDQGSADGEKETDQKADPRAAAE